MKKKGTFVESIVDILVKHQVISAKEGIGLVVAFDRSSKTEFDEFVIEEGLIDDINILRALSEYYEVPAFDVVGYFFDYHLLHQFPKDFLLRNALIPLSVDENILAVVASNPSNPELLAEIGQIVSYDVQFRVGLRRDICDAVKEFYDKAITQDLDDDVDIEVQQRDIKLAEKKEVEDYTDEDTLISDSSGEE